MIRQQSSHSGAVQASGNKPGFLDVPQMLYEQAYVWLVFLASLDIMFTWLILARSGIEVNPLAHIIIDAWGMPGAIAFKFALIMISIVICEEVGRHRPVLGRRLAWIGPVLNGVPVSWSMGLIAWHWQLFAINAS